ncbi:MAG: cation:proton antiporter subunit C [Prochlorococcaceae cyanobacterium]
MTAFRALEFLILLAVLAGLIGLLRHRNLFLKVLAMDVTSTGVISLFVLIAARDGLITPILHGDSPVVDPRAALTYADPIPQAVILTAVVIGFSVQALLLLATTLLASRDPTLEVTELDEPEVARPQAGQP